MDEQELEYHLDTLRECDPDYVVDVLEITSDELIRAFPDRARSFIEKEFD